MLHPDTSLKQTICSIDDSVGWGTSSEDDDSIGSPSNWSLHGEEQRKPSGGIDQEHRVQNRRFVKLLYIL